MQQEFTVACREEEIDGLKEAASYLDNQMRSISKGGQVLGMDRCAIMAGLNISHSLIQSEKNLKKQELANTRLQALHEQVDKCISSFKTTP